MKYHSKWYEYDGLFKTEKFGKMIVQYCPEWFNCTTEEIEYEYDCVLVKRRTKTK